ncbi:unnamed protein product [Gongylonema pulchrum]|uniref:DUF608 domain-containing protein n=1 Tax=Gongylonema pulchrum TaxID=637853 RepID=A0A183DI07_9BILA|nr:unnamed protein product [Gongylonema pulchrum]
MRWDVDDDGMIENSGMPDQTYDVWSMHGTSAYCGGLWLCALECYRRFNEELGHSHEVHRIEDIMRNARLAYGKKLWNGYYFNFDERSNTIMADQLCGFWYMCTIDDIIEPDLFDREMVRKQIFSLLA